MSKRIRRGSSYNLFLRYLLIVLVPIFVLLVMGTISVLINQRYVSRQILRSNKRTLGQISNEFRLTSDELDSLALSLSVSSPLLQSLNSILTTPQLTFEQSRVLTTIRNFVDLAAYSRPYVQSLYVYIANKRDKLLTTNDGIVHLSSYYDHSWYRSYLHHPMSELEWTERRLVNPFPRVETGTPVLSIFRRFYSLSGFQVPGVIVLNIDLGYLKRMIDRMKLSPKQRIVVVNSDGQPLLDELPAGRMAGLYRHTGRRSGGQHARIVTIQGLKYVELRLYARDSGWTYASFTPVSVFYRVSNDLRYINIALVLLSFIVGSLATFGASRSSLRHIQSVVGVVEAAERGLPLPQMPDAGGNASSQIAFSILRTFVEHKYLTVQLSERRYRQRTLELLALQAQLNPHFLFNTLETINWKVIQITRRPTEINDMIGNLSRILKYSLQSPFQFETLGNEIKHARDYLAIQRVRYRNKFNVVWEIGDGVESCKVLRFLLQPLIENAIYHGIKEASGVRTIHIAALRGDGRLLIRVVDDGKGIEPDRLAEIREWLAHQDEYTENIGLYNTNKRIQLAFGEAYGLRIESVLGERTEVSVELPFRT